MGALSNYKWLYRSYCSCQVTLGIYYKTITTFKDSTFVSEEVEMERTLPQKENIVFAMYPEALL